MHRDHWCFDFFPFPPDVDVEVASIWALDDFTEHNGATRVVPDSHREPHGVRYTDRRSSSGRDAAWLDRAVPRLDVPRRRCQPQRRGADRHQRRLRARLAAPGREPVPVVHARRGSSSSPSVCSGCSATRSARTRWDTSTVVAARWSCSIPARRARRRASNPADRRLTTLVRRKTRPTPAGDR